MQRSPSSATQQFSVSGSLTAWRGCLAAPTRPSGGEGSRQNEPVGGTSGFRVGLDREPLLARPWSQNDPMAQSRGTVVGTRELVGRCGRIWGWALAILIGGSGCGGEFMRTKHLVPRGKQKQPEGGAHLVPERAAGTEEGAHALIQAIDQFEDLVHERTPAG